MTERTELILYFCGATFFIAIFIAIVLVYRSARDAASFEGVRIKLDGIDESTKFDHEKMDKRIKKVSDRTQFLVAGRIADEVSAARAAEQQDTPKGDDL